MYDVRNIYSKEIHDSCNKMLQKIKENKIRNHKSLNSAPIHHGENENIERQEYKEFISHRNFYAIFNMMTY